MLNLRMYMVMQIKENGNNILNHLRIIQLCDSNFPIGSFNHSYGMETYLRLNKVYNTSTFREWLYVYIKEQFIYSDGMALLMLYDYLNSGDFNSLWNLDRLITVQSVAKETRNGGKLVAGRMLKLFNDLYDIEILKEYDKKILEKQAFGHPAIVFGMLMYSLGINEKEAVIYHMYSTVSTLISNAVRTIPLGQKDGQILLKEFSENAEDLYNILKTLDLDLFGANTPGLELAQIKHENMEFRLFMS